MSRRCVAVIGIDGFSPIYMDRFIREGKLPAIGSIATEGVTSSLTSTLPATTPVAWTTAATGCTPRVTGIDGNLLHRPGDRLDRRLGCYSNRCQAEPLWETASLNGKRSYVIKFPVSYPSSTATFRLDGAAGWAGLKCLHELSSASTASSGPGEDGKLCASTDSWVSEEQAPGNLIWTGRWLLDTLWGGPAVILYVAVTQPQHGTVVVSIGDAPDWCRVLTQLAPGEWSPVLTIRASGRRSESDYSFRIKVLACVSNPFHLRLYHTTLHERGGHSIPDSLWQKYLAQIGPIEEQTDPSLFFAGNIDLDTQLEIFDLNAEWLKRVSTAVLTQEHWDLFMIHVHFTDWAHHMFHGALDSRHPGFSANTADQYERILLDCYRMADDIVGDIQQVLGEDANIVVMGDHGQDLHHTTVHTNEWLSTLGLLHWEGDSDEVDWSRTLVYAAGNYLYLNLEGREPTGIVPRRHAEALKSRLIEALHDLRDPLNNESRPILAVGQQLDLMQLGTSGPGVGDLIILCRSGYQLRNSRGRLFATTQLFREFTSGHDHFSPLDHRIQTRFFAAGPSFQRGYRHPCAEPLVNVAPTICAAIDMEPSFQCEGKAVSEFLRTPPRNLGTKRASSSTRTD